MWTWVIKLGFSGGASSVLNCGAVSLAPKILDSTEPQFLHIPDGNTRSNTNKGSFIERFLRTEEEADIKQRGDKLWVNCCCHHWTFNLDHSFSLDTLSLPSLDTQSDQVSGSTGRQMGFRWKLTSHLFGKKPPRYSSGYSVSGLGPRQMATTPATPSPPPAGV